MRKFLVLLTLAFGFVIFLFTKEEFTGLELVDTGDLVLVDQVDPEQAEPEDGGTGQTQGGSPVETITGRVVRVDGSGVPGMRVRLEHPWVPEVATVTDAEGNFSLTPSELRGELLPESTTWMLVGGTRNLTPSHAEEYLIVVAQPVSLHGRVTSLEGSPVEGARIFGHPPSNAMVPLGISAIPVETPDQVSFTNSEGAFRVGPLANVPGTLVEVTRRGYRPVTVPVPEDPAQEILVLLEAVPN